MHLENTKKKVTGLDEKYNSIQKLEHVNPKHAPGIEINVYRNVTLYPYILNNGTEHKQLTFTCMI